MTLYAYIRVSARTQNEQRQINAIKDKYPMILDSNIIVEKASGKNFLDRKLYQELKARLQPNDLLIIHSLDRLGRDFTGTAKEWEEITSKGIDIDVIDMPILNTQNNKAGLTGELITKLIVQILSYVGNIEREFNQERRQGGIENWKKTGKTKTGRAYGRPKKNKKEIPSKFIEYYKKGYKAVEIQRLCSISKPTYYRWLEMLR